MLARLAVFAGGATLAAVEDVCGAGVDALEDALAGLLDKSLLFSDAPPEGGEPRLRMLEPVRDYAGERLAESSERQDIRRRHLEHFSGLGREAQPFLCGPRQREWATLFDAERANAREAVEAGMDLDEPAMVLRLVWDTLVYFYIRDAVDEAREWLLRLAVHRPDLDDVGAALLDVGLLVVGEQSIAGGPTVVLARAEPVFAMHGLPLEAAVSLHHLGLRHRYRADTAAAIAALETASERYGGIDHDWGVATVEMTLGAVYAAGGDRNRSAVHYARSLEHSRVIDNRPQMAQGLQGLALIRALDGRLEEAWDALVEAAEIAREARSLTGVSYCLEALAAVDAAEGDHEAAARCLGSAREVRRRFAVPEWTAAADAAGLVAVEV